MACGTPFASSVVAIVLLMDESHQEARQLRDFVVRLRKYIWLFSKQFTNFPVNYFLVAGMVISHAPSRYKHTVTRSAWTVENTSLIPLKRCDLCTHGRWRSLIWRSWNRLPFPFPSHPRRRKTTASKRLHSCLHLTRKNGRNYFGLVSAR